MGDGVKAEDLKVEGEVDPASLEVGSGTGAENVADGAQVLEEANVLKQEGEHAESSGNNASNGTTQRLEKAEEAVGEASTTAKPPSDDLVELANRGLCAPLWRTAKPSQSGVGVPDVEQLQNGWCNYHGQDDVQRGATWTANSSPSVQARLQQQQQQQQPLGGYRSSQGAGGQAERPLPASAEKVVSARPPGTSLPALPPSPFSKAGVSFGPGTGAEAGAALATILSEDSPFTHSGQTKVQWNEDAHSPHLSGSDAQQTELQGAALPRQASLPDFGELADIWSCLPDDNLDLETLPSILKDGGPLLTQASLGLRQHSLSRFGRMSSDVAVPVGSILQGLKSQRRSRSVKLNSALTWQPGGYDMPLQPRRSASRLQSLHMVPAAHDITSPADRSGSSGFQGPSEGPRPRQLELPEAVTLSIVGAPSSFAVPTCINKMFKPSFTLRVSIVSSRPTQIKATVAAYTLQSEQIAKLEQWHPSQHIFTESLSGAILSQSITCEGPENPKTGESFPGKHVGSGDITFSELKFNSSSRMKPRWLVFALALPTDDVIFVQYTVPTIVMSRQCDQTPRALAILRGEVPTRKRARQSDSHDSQRARPSPGLASPSPMSLRTTGPASLGLYGMRGGVSPAEPDAMNMASPFPQPTEDWPQRGPYSMARWREAIVKVCREYGLTRSFEQEDMHELAKVAGFMASSPLAPSQSSSVLTHQQWNNFGKWFLSHLHILKDHRHLWMSTSVVCMCGFSATRERAEQLLMGQPEGTFLLRPSLAMEATIVISVMLPVGICHLAIDAQQLESKTLEDWVLDLPEVQYLLDINTGARYPKLQIFRSRTPIAFGLPGLQAPFMSPMDPLSPSPHSMMAPTQGNEALAHILEASRRGADSFSHPGMAFSPLMGGPGQGVGLQSPADPHMGSAYDRWGGMAPFSGHMGMAQHQDLSLGSASIHSAVSHSMRFSR